MFFSEKDEAERAAPTIHRVVALEASNGGAPRNSKARPPCSAAASDSRRVATRSMARSLRISPITAPTQRQRRASSIAHSTSRTFGAATRSNRSGASPNSSKPIPHGAPFSHRVMSSVIQTTCRRSLVCWRTFACWTEKALAAIAKVKPVAAAMSDSRGAAISCSAPRINPPPSG